MRAAVSYVTGDATLARALTAALAGTYAVLEADEARAADVVLLDLRDPAALDTLTALRDGGAAVVVLTDDDDLAGRALRAGALDRLPAAPEPAAVWAAVRTIADDASIRAHAALAGAVGAAVVAVGPDGTVRYANAAAGDLCGCPLDGRPVTEVPVFARAATAPDGRWAGDVDGVRADGTPLRARLAVRPLTGSDGRLVALMAVATDMTAARVTEETAVRMSAIVESSDDAIISRDIDGIVTSWNAAAERLVGYSAAEAVGRHAVFATPPERHAQIHDVIARVGRGETVPAYEQVVLRKDGSRAHISLSVSAIRDENGAVIGSSAIARDITEQVELRRAAEDDRRRLAEAQALAGLGSFEMLLDSDERIWSAEMYRIFGVEPGRQVTETMMLERLHPEDRSALLAARIEARTQSGPVDVAYRVVWPDGEQRSVVVRMHGRADDDGVVRRLVGTVLDVTDRTRADDERRAAERRFELGFHHAAAGTAIVDLDGRLVRVNAALCRLLGRDEEELVGRRPVEFVHAADLAAPTPFAEAIGGQGRGGAELRFVRADGAVVETLVDVVVVRGERGDPEYLFAQLLDITRRKEAERALEHQALHDALTGLPNRALLLDRLDHALAQRGRRGPVAALLVDLDQFKLVNDGIGHWAGDALLVAAAARLAVAVRPGDTVGRLGGDEFVVCCEDVNGPAEATAIAERVAAAFAAPFEIERRELFITVSIGVTLSEPGATPDSLLRDADAAMYRAKERGRARVELFDEALRDRAAARLATANSLRRAVRENEIAVHYQPVLSLADERLTGFEALVRWQDPERGLVAPAEFVPVAEETGLIVPLGAEVLRVAAGQLAEWSATFPGAGDLTMAVNVSARQLIDPSFVPTVAETLAATGLDPARIHLEITESVLMEDAEDSIRVLGLLDGLGVGIAIDDFGTGYSSLSYLKRLPVDTLKIDRSFVAGLGTSAEDTSIVTAIVALGRALGLRLHAEGVETEEQRVAAWSIGCEVAQGFHWGRAVPAREAERWLRRRVMGVVPEQRRGAQVAAG